MKIIVAGTRTIADKKTISDAIAASQYLTGTDEDEIVSGLAPGPDTVGREYAIEHGIKYKDFPAYWDIYGKRAGMIRNKQMGDYADKLIAVWDGVSVGTQNMIDYMRSLKKSVYVYYVFHPLQDGITHINIYSKGRTKLGRLLSNFAHTPIKHPKYGYFTSIEGFWYWLGTGMKHDDLRNLHGHQAKSIGKTYAQVDYLWFIEEIEEALEIKLSQHPGIADLLCESTLPLTHYYYFGTPENAKVIRNTVNNWVIEFFDRWRTDEQRRRKNDLWKAERTDDFGLSSIDCDLSLT